MQILNKNLSKSKLMNLKKILKAHRQPLSASIRNLICSTPGSLFKSLCHTVFPRKPHHLPSRWLTGVSQNHRATFQAKSIFQGSCHHSESGRTESTECPGMWQWHRSCCLQPSLQSACQGGTRAPAQQHTLGFLLSLLQFSCLFASFSTLFCARP